MTWLYFIHDIDKVKFVVFIINQLVITQVYINYSGDYPGGRKHLGIHTEHLQGDVDVDCDQVPVTEILTS